MSRASSVPPCAVLAAVFVSVAQGGCHSSVPAVEVAPQRSSTSASQVLRVPSKDGTRIAVECGGAGPTLLLVHGGMGDRTRWTPMIPRLSSHFTLCAMDRRDPRDISQPRLRRTVAGVA